MYESYFLCVLLQVKNSKVLLYEILGVGDVIVHKFWYFFNLLT